MGYRIELEEIENALLHLEGIRQAAVFYVRSNSAFGKIYAYAAYSGDKEAATLLEALKKYIPLYMIPSKLFLSDELPKNANGKVDKQFLKNQLPG